MIRFRYVLTVALLTVLSLTVSAKTPKYVFYFIGDGMGINQAAATEMYMHSAGLGDLNFRHFPVVGFVTTTPANSRVTDSAAAGTALATGCKTYNGAIGLQADTTAVDDLTEKAIRSGFAAGVVSSDAVTLATPAAFYAHTAKRGNYEDIAAQLVDSKLDFVAGASIWTKQNPSGYWESKAEEKGFTVFSGSDNYSYVKSPVIYLSNDVARNDLRYSLDRREGDTRLADFTAAAIDHLYRNSRKGFFLMVEGALVDHACHSRDAGSMVHEIMDLSESIDLALAFYDKHPDETLIIVTADHETGHTLVSYGDTKLIGEQKCSMNALTAKFMQMNADGNVPSWAEVKDVLRENLGLWDSVPVNPRQEKVFTLLYKESFLDNSSELEKDLYSSNQRLAAEAVRYLGSKAGIEMYGSGHSGSPVGLYVKGAGSGKFVDCRDNTDIPKIVAKVARYR